MTMMWLSAPAGSSVAASIVALLLVFGFAQCAAGSCLSYGHSCWGAHGKRSDPVTADDMPDDGPEAVAAVGIPEDTRWFVSKLVRQVEPRGKMWRRLTGISVPPVGVQRPLRWENEGAAESPADNEVPSRVRSLDLDGSEESPAGIVVHAREEYPVDEGRDGEVLVMTDDKAIRRVPQNLRVYTITNHEGRKLD